MVTYRLLVEPHSKVWQNTGVMKDINLAIQLAERVSVLVFGAGWHQGVNLNHFVGNKVSNLQSRDWYMYYLTFRLL